MLKLSHTSNTSKAAAQLREFPNLIRDHIRPKLNIGSEEARRELQRNARKFDAFTTNSKSVYVKVLGAFEREVGTASGYGRYLAEGQPGPLKRFPNVTALFAYVKRRNPGISVRNADWRAYLLGKALKDKGIKPHDYVTPTMEKMAPRIQELLQEGVDEALMMLGGGEL